MPIRGVLCWIRVSLLLRGPMRRSKQVTLELSSMLPSRELDWMVHPVLVGTRSTPLIDWTRYAC